MRMPLAGIKVLDFTHGVAGPYASMVLADLGGDVIKVEKPGRGDATRYMNVGERFADGIPETGGDYFLAINRNKRAVTLDIQDPRGREAALRLARWADVALQSFRPGVMTRLGLDYAALSAVNPRIVYGNLSAYGRKGPLADKPGMDVAVQARSGVMTITGSPDSAEPLRPGVSLADFAGGIYLATALVTALFHRERTGEGQEVDVSLLDATMSMLVNYSVAVLDGGAKMGPMGSGHPQLVPYQAFPTKDGHVVIATGTNKLYREFCAALGRADLADDPRFRSNQDRVRHRQALVALLSDLTRGRTTAEWIERLERAEIPCAPVLDMEQAFAEPQLAENDMVVPLEHPGAGTIHVLGVPFKFGRVAGAVRTPPPRLGEHTRQVLEEVAGLPAEEIERLAADGVI